MIVCIPGPWLDRSAFVQRVITLEPAGRFVFAGGVLADVEYQHQVPLDFLGHHPRMLEAFQAATRGDLSPELANAITEHQSSIYLQFPLDFLNQREQVLKFTKVVERLGGIAIKLESSGVGHSWQRWFKLLSSENLFDWYCAMVILLGTEHDYYSCGMHHFKLPDSSIGTELPIKEAAIVLNKFNYWRLLERPELESGEIFGVGGGESRFRLRLKPDDLNPKGDLFNNPYGIWRLTKE